MNLREYARGKPCMIRLPGICNRDNTTTVLCHERISGLSGAGLKAPDFFAAWGGISSVGLGLPILWTEGTRRDANFSIEDVVRWCCRNTAKQVGLERTKGDLGVGFDADIVIFDDEESFVVS